MTVNESRLAVSAELVHKLRNLNICASLAYLPKDLYTTTEQIKNSPNYVARRIMEISALVEVMHDTYFSCIDLAEDILHSLETKKPCVLITNSDTVKGGETE